ncbi:MAG: hypothetical protein INR71_00900 [Terriglobus roseus]|nr:hypothetical protein [Terriglobus roseus]
MFWRFGGYANISTLDTILDKPDVTVEELLDESDLIQELKQQNSKLIEFLRADAVLEKLLAYVVAPKVERPAASPPPPPPPPRDEESEPERSREAVVRKRAGSALDSFFGKGRSRSRSTGKPRADDGDGEAEAEGDDGEESKENKRRMKYAYVACEVLSSDVWSISEAVMEHRDALRSFWRYVKQPAPLDPVQAGYFTKVNECLLDRKTEEMLHLFKSIDNVVPDMLQHVDCPTVMDLLLKVVSLERSDGGQGIVDWLQQQRLVPILLSYLSPDHSSAAQTSAGDFLKAIITISANATTQDQNVIGPNELTRQLVSEPCVQLLVTEMLRGGNPLTVGVGIVIEVIRKNNSDYDLENQIGPVPRSSDPIYLGTLLRQFAKSVPHFMQLILDPDHKVTNSDGTVVVRRREMKAAWGQTIEPLGFDRFKTCELMAELLHCSNMALLNERGSEAEVRRRDKERERLKADGKLQARRDEHEASSHDFGTSVDSAGFHHARAPSMSDESPEHVKRAELAAGGDDDDFETVARSDALADEIKDELDEALLGEPLERSPKVSPKLGPRVTSSERVPQLEPATDKDHVAGNHEPSADSIPPLKPRRPDEKSQTPAADALNDTVDRLNLDNHQPESAEAQSSTTTDDDGSGPDTPTSSEMASAGAESAPNMSPHPEDKPAPLFASKKPSVSVGDDSAAPSAASETTDLSEPAPTDDAESDPALANADDAYPTAYVLDTDGSPVVGDLLKMMFVEHRVVPTILVRLPRSQSPPRRPLMIF